MRRCAFAMDQVCFFHLLLLRNITSDTRVFISVTLTVHLFVIAYQILSSRSSQMIRRKRRRCSSRKKPKYRNTCGVDGMMTMMTTTMTMASFNFASFSCLELFCPRCCCVSDKTKKLFLWAIFPLIVQCAFSLFIKLHMVCNASSRFILNGC